MATRVGDALRRRRGTDPAPTAPLTGGVDRRRACRGRVPARPRRRRGPGRGRVGLGALRGRPEPGQGSTGRRRRADRRPTRRRRPHVATASRASRPGVGGSGPWDREVVPATPAWTGSWRSGPTRCGGRGRRSSMAGSTSWWPGCRAGPAGRRSCSTSLAEPTTGNDPVAIARRLPTVEPMTDAPAGPPAWPPTPSDGSTAPQGWTPLDGWTPPAGAPPPPGAWPPPPPWGAPGTVPPAPPQCAHPYTYGAPPVGPPDMIPLAPSVGSRRWWACWRPSWRSWR